MSNVRIAFSEAQHIALVSQVQRICPLCDSPLFYTKGSRTYKKYEIAHIYPLNPRPYEATLLQGQELLSSDVNDEKNLIPLCIDCHTKFDKPRTVDGYQQLVKIKKHILQVEAQQLLASQHHVQVDINHVIAALYNDEILHAVPLDFIPIEINKKLTGQISNLTKRKIKNYVVDYFPYIKQRFAELDALKPASADVVAGQVKLFYLQQVLLGLSQQEIFNNLVAWIYTKAKPETVEAAEILVSFFIQNCEVFDDNSK